jgi:hypothetical protein
LPSFGNPETFKLTLMKKLVLSVLVGLAALMLMPSVYAANTAVVLPGSSAPTPIEDPTNAKLVQEFLNLTPKKYYELTGKKMKMSQKISLKLAQMKVKRMLKKGKTVDLLSLTQKGIDTSDFNIVGFLLGIFLFLIGVLIAYLIGDDDVIKWAWLGAGLIAILWLLVLVL